MWKISNKKSILLYILSAILFLFFAIFNFTNAVNIQTIIKIFFLILGCLFFYFGSAELVKNMSVEKRSKVMKITFLLFFGIYLFLLIDLVLFEKNYGRTGFSINYDNFEYYMKNSFNIVPFVTIARYSPKYTSFSVFSLNIIGNLIALMPLLFFLNIFLKNKLKFQSVCLVGVLTSLAIETAQLITLSGSFDIDDIILNSLGIIIAYFIFNIKFIDLKLKKIIRIEQ